MRLRKKQHRPGCHIDIAPLIDVVFLLIIFFMVVAQFTQAELEALELPSAEQADLPDATLQSRLVVNVHADGRIIIASRNQTLDSFRQFLRRELSQRSPEQISVLIRADRRTSWEAVRPLLTICAEHQIIRIRVAVVDAEPIETNARD